MISRAIAFIRRQMLVISVIGLLACCLFVPAACKTAFVQQVPGWNTTTFKKALTDPSVDTIVFVDDRYVVGSDLDEYVTSPYKLTRNITLTGLHGTETVLDLAFKRSIVHICSTCTFRFLNITVAGDRRGNGFQWDFLVGDYGSRVLIEDTYKWRIACTATKDWGVVIDQMKRSKLNPGVDKPQSYTLVNVTYKGKFFPDSLFNYDVSVDAPYVIQEGSAPQGGYSQWGRNVTRLCDVIVPLSCMETKSPDACVNDAIDRALAGPGREAAGPKGAALVAAVVVPIVVAGALAAVGAVLWLRRRQHRLADAKLLAVKQSYNPAKDVEDGTGSSRVYSASSGLLAPGWTVLHSLTPPSTQGSGFSLGDRIVFGDLLGAGSFGRVYKASWGGQDVAVKVIEHDVASAAAVENEVQLMMRFSHRNIVRALHCITFQCNQAEPAHQARSGSARGSGSANSSGTGTGKGTGTGPEADTGTGTDTGTETGIGTGTGTGTGAAVGGATSWAGSSDSPPPAGVTCLKTSESEAATAAAPTSAECSSEGTAGRGSIAPTSSTTRRKPRAAGASAATQARPQSAAATTAVKAAAAVKKAETWVVQELCDCGTLSSVVSGLEPLVASDTVAGLPDSAAAGEALADSNATTQTAGCVDAANTLDAAAGSAFDWSQCKQEGLLARLQLLLDAAAGLRALHEHNVVHGDLNARNVLVSSDPSSPTGMVAKLADLGLARVIKQQKTHRTTQTVGTMSHMPPELLRSGRMAPAGDVYAFGIMMHEVFTGQAPFKALHYGQFFEAIVLRNLRPSILPGMPADYVTLMQRCWAAEAAQRPTTQQLWECLQYMVNVQMHGSAAGTAAGAVQLQVPGLLLNRPEGAQQQQQLELDNEPADGFLGHNLQEQHGVDR